MAADQALGYTATQYNISEFISNGGKQLFFHGAADAWFSANETERYFNAMAASNAELQPAEDYSRLYLVPGMGHCAGGEQTLDSFDMLTPLVDWVENNQPPEAVIATGRSMPGQSRPLCPYPSYAHFEGGDAAEAASYSCRTP
jgi:feruloyl esterase